MKTVQVQRNLRPLIRREDPLPPRQHLLRHNSQTNSSPLFPASRPPIRRVVRRSHPPLVPPQRLPNQLLPLLDNPVRRISPLDRHLPIPILRFARPLPSSGTVARTPGLRCAREALVPVRSKFEERGAVPHVERCKGCSGRESRKEGGRTEVNAGRVAGLGIACLHLRRRRRAGGEKDRDGSSELNGATEASASRVESDVPSDLLLVLRASAGGLSESREVEVGTFVAADLLVVTRGWGRTTLCSLLVVRAHDLHESLVPAWSDVRKVRTGGIECKKSQFPSFRQ